MTVPRCFALLSLPLLWSFAAAGQQYTISTYAGGAPPPTPVMGTAASIGQASGVATDAAGNVYFSSLHCVFKLDRSGVLTRIAGNARPGYSGDGGPATNAQLYDASGVAVDGTGNLYIAELGNNRVRRVTPAGVINAVAGNGSGGYSGDGGPATNARLYAPSGIAVDGAGNLYIADYATSRIRKVTPAGVINTVAGNGSGGYSGDGGPANSAQLYYPSGVAVDSAGNLYIADSGNSRVRKVTPAGIISTVAGNGTSGYSGDGGPATSAQLHAPSAIAVDSAGNLYIADSGNSRVRKVTPAGVISTMAGNGTSGYSGDGGPANSAQLAPSAIAVDSAGNLYIADYATSRIRKVTPAGIISTVAGNGTQCYSGDGGPATSAQLNRANAVAVDSAGNLYISDADNNRVRRVTPAGVISTVAGNGSKGDSGDGGPATSAQLLYPSGVAVDSAGNLFIADRSHIRKVTSAGIISTVAGSGSLFDTGDGGPAISARIDAIGVAVDSAGNLYIADQFNNRVRRVTPAGVISTVAGNGSQGYSGDGGPATNAQLGEVRSVAVDNAGNLYIADAVNRRIRRVTQAGVISTVAGNGSGGDTGDGGTATSASLSHPGGVAVDGVGNLYISAGDIFYAFDNRIRRVTPTGVISTVAGNGSQGYSGDGGPATSAQLNGANAVAVDSAGKIYIADAVSNAIRLLTPPGSASNAPALLAGGIVPAGSSVNTIQPGEWVSIYGTNLAESITSWNGTFTTALGGTSVTINGKPAYLSYVSPIQINLQAPDDPAIGPVSVVVTTANGTTTGTVTLAPVAPSFLLLDNKHVAGIILRTDGSGAYGGGSYDIIGPAGTSLGYATVPAKAGDLVSLFATGLGPTNPAVGAGRPFSGAAPATNTVSVFINNASVTPSFAGLSGAGLFQINLQVPAGLGAGDVPLSVLVGGSQTQSGVVISLT